MADIVVVGSINMDLVTTVSNMPKVGETILGSKFNQIPGGKGANQAVTIARLESKIDMIGKVGNDSFGNTMLKTLKDENIGIKNISISSKEKTGIAIIIVDDNGDNSIVVVSGSNYELNNIDIDKALNTIIDSKIIVSQLEIPLETVSYLFKTAKSLGKYTILNPAPAAKLDSEMISNIDLLTPNETELELLSNISINNEEDIIKASKILLNQGLKEIIITLGEKGCMYVNKEGHKKYPSIKVEAIDTTAAGDSFTGAIAVALSNGKNIDDAILFATKVAALTVTKFGAISSLPYSNEVQELEQQKEN